MPRHLAILTMAVTLSASSTLAGQTPTPFTLTSPDVHAGQQIASAQVFKGMNCTGANISPALQWHGAPARAKSFAITLYDPDAPTGSGWWHWVAYDIPAGTTRLAAGAGDPAKALMPPGSMQGNTDFGTPGYGGPCPPPGDKPHHYRFTVYALDVAKLDVPATATAAYVGFYLHAHRIGTATLTGVYRR